MQIRNMILKVDGKTTSVLVDMTTCQKMYSKHAECLPCVGDVLDIVANCLTLLDENIELMDSPNDNAASRLETGDFSVHYQMNLMMIQICDCG